ncbi:phage tail tape measure protein [Bacteroides caecimuris]|uniref:phage tail tape measure protein n=1 Tax=Bacteroides caecimuris TaxID=1796613 RepID=UPI001C3D38E6|nr:phage tail tape measure protein [Bacteroides caecimuris]
MADLKLKDFVDESDLQKLVELDNTIERVRADYANAAKELAKGLKLNVEGVADLEKLSNLYNTQAKTAGSASAELTEALRKQSEITQTVSKKIEEKLNVEKLSAAELKKLTKANSDNAASLEKAAKAEANLTKAQNAGNTTRKKAVLSEEERLKLIRTAITLTNQEVHSRSQAKEMNKQLQKAVDVLKDTDENYIRTLARLNSTIGINTDYIKRNSDRYSQQKMTIGAYREEVKAAWVEIQNGNKSMQNMGIIARNAGRMLKTEMAPGLSQVSAGLKGWAAGYIGAQAVVGGIVKMFTQLREGVGSIVEFEFANSKLAAILGTTADNIKELTTDARQLGATTKYTAAQATELQIELAKLGFTRREILDSTGAILRFAQATGAELSDAAALSGAALRMFNASTKETERYVSAMAVATSKSALSFSYLATALPIVGPVAKAFNFQIEDTLALLGKLADAGFDASMSATATRNILLNLADGNGKLAKALGEPVKTLPELVVGLKKLKEQGVDLNTTLELTDKRSVAAFNAFLTASDKIVPLRDQITGVDKELTDMADTMSNNVKGSIAGLSSAWEAFMLSFYDSKGIMKDVLDFLARGLRNVATQLKGYSELQDEADNKAVAFAQKEMMKSDILEKNARNMQRLYKEYINSGMSADEAAKKAKEDYIETLKSRLEYENSDYQLAIDNRKKLEGELKDRGFFTILTSWRRTNNVIKDEIDVATKAAAGKKAISSITESLIEQLDTIDLKENGGTKGNSVKVLTDKEKREQEKALKEKLKIHETYQESELALMDEGLEKELAKIGVAYSKKIAAVKGNNKEEIATRQNLAKEMQEKLDEFTIKYNSDREKKDVENALVVVKKGSQEELDLKLHQLELQREAEIDAAEKTGEDVFLIDDKYAKKKQELYERHASDQVQLIAENAAHEQEIRDAAYVMDTLALKKQLASMEITQQEYAELEYQLKLDYVRKTAEAAIDALELELQDENLSAEDRARIAEQLQKLKADIAQKEAEAEIDAINKVTKADEKAQKERQKNLKKWLQTASQAVGAIGNLVSSIYDGQIQKIEEEREANEEKYDEDIERIENLAESGAISEEEAEARKRAAKDQTEAKNKELEKQKQEIAHKQAVWHKGVQVAETGIATARGIMEAFQLGPIAGAVMAAVIGAMGAMQVATILATPIPSYAEGTKGNDRHPGGTALVGDAGKHEVIMYSGKAWITPDTPTLVDIPKGAQVFPDVDKVDISNFDIPDWDFPTFSPTYFASSSGDTIVFNDYSRLEKRVDRTNFLLMKSLKMQRQDASNREFELYKLSKLK